MEGLEQTGVWLFRWRSYFPLLLLVILVPAYFEYDYPFGSESHALLWEIGCLAVSLSGLMIRGYTIGHTPKDTSGRNTRAQLAATLNTSGMYSVTRNPLYLGNFLMVLGVVMFVHVWWASVIYVLAFWLYYERIIMAEEAFLRGKFGTLYDSYLRATPAFFPNPALWIPPSLPFSLRNVLKREYSGFFAVFVAFAIQDLVVDFLKKASLDLYTFWLAMFVLGLAAYVLLRTLKKHTRLLHVAGR